MTRIIRVFASSETGIKVLKNVGLYMTGVLKLEHHLVDTTKPIDEIIINEPAAFINIVPVIGADFSQTEFISALLARGENVIVVAVMHPTDAGTMIAILEGASDVSCRAKWCYGFLSRDKRLVQDEQYPQTVSMMINRVVRVINQTLTGDPDMDAERVISAVVSYNTDTQTVQHFHTFTPDHLLK